MKILIVVVVVLAVLYFILKQKQATANQPQTLAGIWSSIKTQFGI